MAILNGTAIEIDTALIESYRSVTAELAKWQNAAQAIRELIEESMGDAEYATVNNEPVIRWSHTKRRRLDLDKLRGAVDPAVLAECYVEDVGRRFLPLKTKTWEPGGEQS